jgi:OmpA-OmpF porin, OOP family
MSKNKSRGTRSLAAAALMGLFAAHAATAQERKNLPDDATAHFVYFDTASHALSAKDEGQIRDVAAMMQSMPTVVATIIGKTDSVGSAEFNEHLSKQRADAVFGSLVYDNKVPQDRVEVCWTGERLPFMSAADETANSQNRLVAIVVSKATAAYYCGR